MKKEQSYEIDIQFANLKDLFKSGKGDSIEFDELSREMLDYMGRLTISGVSGDTIIEKIPLDLWKDRVFHLIERAGLLPEYKMVEEVEEDELNDSDWYGDNGEFTFGESEPILTKIERI
jgi:hypothetical protein|tara:strand:- start:597 stop:953 length:357 start_codon:yes stop_codon:yes gene_type:complete